MKDKILEFTYKAIANVNDPIDLIYLSKIYVKGVDDNIYINKNRIKFKSITIDINQVIYDDIRKKMMEKIKSINSLYEKNDIKIIDEYLF